VVGKLKFSFYGRNAFITKSLGRRPDQYRTLYRGLFCCRLRSTTSASYVFFSWDLEQSYLGQWRLSSRSQYMQLHKVEFARWDGFDEPMWKACEGGMASACESRSTNIDTLGDSLAYIKYIRTYERATRIERGREETRQNSMAHTRRNRNPWSGTYWSAATQG
jgi:hypothetical protein